MDKITYILENVVRCKYFEAGVHIKNLIKNSSYQDGLGRTTQTLDHVVVVHILIWDKRKSQINEYSDRITHTFQHWSSVNPYMLQHATSKVRCHSVTMMSIICITKTRTAPPKYPFHVQAKSSWDGSQHQTNLIQASSFAVCVGITWEHESLNSVKEVITKNNQNTLKRIYSNLCIHKRQVNYKDSGLVGSDSYASFTHLHQG
jgi:hypothetical protein